MKGNGEISKSIEKNVQVVKDFFAAIGSGDKQRVLALVAEDIEWIVPKAPGSNAATSTEGSNYGKA
jgi:ketosteroid isomerase-like protein